MSGMWKASKVRFSEKIHNVPSKIDHVPKVTAMMFSLPWFPLNPKHIGLGVKGKTKFHHWHVVLSLFSLPFFGSSHVLSLLWHSYPLTHRLNTTASLHLLYLHLHISTSASLDPPYRHHNQHTSSVSPPLHLPPFRHLSRHAILQRDEQIT